MTFPLKTTRVFYYISDARALETLGFTFTMRGHAKRPCVMVVKGDEVQVEVATLEDLVAFARKWGNIIVSTDRLVPTLEIYDGYRE